MNHQTTNSYNSIEPLIDEGVPIPHRPSDGHYSVNAIMQATGKGFGEYMHDTQGSDLIDLLKKERAGIDHKPIKTDYHGQSPGTTWVQPDLTIHFACWGSPRFAVMYTGLVSQMFRSMIATNSIPPVPDGIKGLVDILVAGVSAGMNDPKSEN